MATLLIAVWVVSGNLPPRVPLLAAVGALTALFAFATIEPYYQRTGAAPALANLVIVLVGVCWPEGCGPSIRFGGVSSHFWQL